MSTVYTDFAGIPVSARLCEIYLPKAPGTRPCPVGPPEEPHPLLMGSENISLRLFKMPFFCSDHPYIFDSSSRHTLRPVSVAHLHDRR